MWLFWLLFIIGIVFTLLIYFDKTDLDTRYVFLVVLLVGTLLSMLMSNLELRDFGVRMPTIESAAAFGLATLAGWIVIEITGVRGKMHFGKYSNSKIITDKLFYVLISVPLQEFIFRGYTLAVLRAFGWNSLTFYILVSGFAFSFAHLFLKNIVLMAYTFLVSLVWGVIFYYYPDLLSLSISHCVLGALLLGERSQKRQVLRRAVDVV